MHPMLIWIACDDYYDICQLFVLSGYHIRNKKNRIRDLCRVQKPWHTAKKPMFTVCQSQGTRQTFELCRVPRLQAHGKGGRHVTSQVFCFFFYHGSALAHGKGRLCRRLNVVCSLPCAYGALPCALAHDKAAVSHSD